MVYESDFYTTRRPYTRPLVSSYSITGPIIPLSSVIQLRNIPYMPYVAHKRLVHVVHTPLHSVYHAGVLVPIRIHSRVRPSVLAAEINRIRTLPRPSTVSYTEKFLNSKDTIYFDDEAKEIRAKVDSLLRRVHVYIPRAVASDFAEEIVPERMRSNDYVRRLLSGRNNEKKEADLWSWYDVPERGNFGTLSCVKYVGGKPQSVRRPYYKVADLRPSDIRNDVNLLSYYSKNRQAAANALKQQREEISKRAEKFLADEIERTRTAEEKRQAAEDERVRLELEEEKAWKALQLAQERKAEMSEILQQERDLAQKKIEEEEREAERVETERVLNEEREVNEARLRNMLEEQERMIVEEHLEEVRQREERDERLADVIHPCSADDKAADRSTEDVLSGEITEQEREEKPYELINDDDTRLEEENVPEDNVETSNPFVEEPEGAELSQVKADVGAVDDAPKIEEVTSGGEESFEWGDEDM